MINSGSGRKDDKFGQMFIARVATCLYGFESRQKGQATYKQDGPESLARISNTYGHMIDANMEQRRYLGVYNNLGQVAKGLHGCVFSNDAAKRSAQIVRCLLEQLGFRLIGPADEMLDELKDRIEAMDATGIERVLNKCFAKPVA